MQSVVSFRASDVSSDQLRGILSAHLAVDRARVRRRITVVRFVLLALAAALLETVFRGFSAFARWITVALCLLPPLWTWIIELHRQQRLWWRIQDIDGTLSRRLPPNAAAPGTYKKVVKSS